MFKTITLTGTEQAVTFAGRHQYFHVHNLGGGEVLASLAPEVERGKNGVLIVPSGGTGYVQVDMATDTVYLTGSGEVQVAGTGNAFSPFKSGSKGGGEVASESGAIAGTVDYPILSLNLYGKSVQNGTPTPDVPIDIVSVGDNGTINIDACGKNLLKNTATTRTVNGVTFTVNDDGSVTVNGTSTAGNTFLNLNYKDYFSRNMPKGTYVLSGGTGQVRIEWLGYTTENETKILGRDVGNNFVCTLDDTLSADWIRIQIATSDTVIDNVTIYPQVEKGTIATAYEPYIGNTATITSGLPLCAVDNVRDELIYNADGTGKIIKRVRRVELTGNEEWNSSYSTELQAYAFRCNMYGAYKDTQYPGGIGLCSHYIFNSKGNDVAYSVRFTTGSDDILWFYAMDYDTVDDWTSYLAENPVTVLYRLAKPQEIELSAAEMAALQKLQTFDGVTNIYNDEGAEMSVKYCTNPLLSEYVMPVIEGITAKFEKRIAALESAIISNT